MKRLFLLMLVFAMVTSVAACSSQQQPSATAIPTKEPAAEPVQEEQVQDWSYDESTKTLYVNTDMGAFEPDAPDADGTTSNAPWSDYLGEIENIVVSDDVTFIGDYAFAFCPNLKNVEVGNNVGALDFRCFFECGDWENDTNIDFHFNSMPNFGDDAFGYTWDNPNVMIYVPDDMKDYWADYIRQKGEMQLDGYEMNFSFSRDDVLFSTLMNPQELFYEGRDQMAENEGGQFGYIAEKRVDDERMEIFSGDQNALMPLNTRLCDFGNENRPQQAVLMRFQPENVSNLNFTFIGMGEFVIAFEENQLYFSDVKTGMTMAFSDYLPNNFNLDWMAHYYIFAAVDADANLKVMVWEDGNPENQAYYEYCLYQGMDDIFESNWQMFIGFGADGQLNIYEYWVYTFDEFMDGTPYVVNQNVQCNDMQNDNNNDGDDYGPYWEINIGGNFNIMSDMVWQSIEPQDIKIGSGDTFKGYVLKDMMDLAGHGSDKASVTFAEQGIENAEVDPTYDAYIVYMQNGEFLGGPYLLTIEGLWEYPVTEVNPQ